MRRLIGSLVAVSGGEPVVARKFVARSSRFAGKSIPIAHAAADAAVAEIAGAALSRLSASA